VCWCAFCAFVRGAERIVRFLNLHEWKSWPTSGKLSGVNACSFFFFFSGITNVVL
jgi:hypothetical protein